VASLDRGHYLMLWRNSSFTYVDVRLLKNEHTEIIGYDQIRAAIASGKPQASSFWSFLTGRPRYEACWPVKDGQGRILAIVRVEKRRFG